MSDVSAGDRGVHRGYIFGKALVTGQKERMEEIRVVMVRAGLRVEREMF
jgi:hypothetical protein